MPRKRPTRALATAANALPVLDPAALSAEALAAVREILAEGESANTVRAYASAWRYWSAWHRLRFGEALTLPLPVPAVVQFVVDHTVRRSNGVDRHELPDAIDQALVAAGIKQRPGPLKLSTVVHRVAALSTIHRLRRLSNPGEDPAVRHVLARARRGHAKRGERPRKKTAAIADTLNAMLATCNDSLIGVRDRALLSFAWASGGRRRSEVAAARLEDLTALPDGSYLFRLTHTKTQQAGARAQDAEKPIAGVAADALRSWLQRSNVRDGALFRRIRGRTTAEALRPAAVAAIVQQRARLAGLEGDFAGHSLRSGFVSEAGRQEVPLPDVMALTGHTQVQSVIGYWRSGAGTTHRISRLLDGLNPDPDASHSTTNSNPTGED